jgi:hypothetical protein
VTKPRAVRRDRTILLLDRRVHWMSVARRHHGARRARSTSAVTRLRGGQGARSTLAVMRLRAARRALLPHRGKRPRDRTSRPSARNGSARDHPSPDHGYVYEYDPLRPSRDCGALALHWQEGVPPA